jgi:hypothetical protein
MAPRRNPSLIMSADDLRHAIMCAEQSSADTASLPVASARTVLDAVRPLVKLLTDTQEEEAPEMDARTRDFDALVTYHAQPLYPIRDALAVHGITLDIVQTGGFAMVGYVWLTDQREHGRHLGITVEGDAQHMVCRYTGEEGDVGDVVGPTTYEPLDVAVARVLGEGTS